MENQPLPSVSAAPRPEGPVVMRQLWRDLLFLHWEWDAEEIAKTLPAGLEVDCFQGRAFLGVVPFFMCRVRPSFFPAVPWLSDFLELNLRTYVRDAAGRPGVWFYSLDCNQALAVTIARLLFHLPYEHAKMKAEKIADGTIRTYLCRRAGQQNEAVFSYGPATNSFHPSRRGSLEEFLVERYRLFSYGGDRVFSGEVWHDPYAIGEVDVAQWSALPMTQAGFHFPAGILRPPDHALFAPGVDVRIFPLRRN